MTRPAKWYAFISIGLGFAAAVYSVYQYAQSLFGQDLYHEAESMFCLILLCAICRSLPIQIDRKLKIDVSILAIIAAVLTHGVYAAVVVYLVGALFTIDVNDATGTHSHIFNTPPVKTLFNNATTGMSILFPGLLIVKMGFVPGVLHLPQVLWPMFVFTVLAFVINYSFISGMFLLNRLTRPGAALRGMAGLLPNVVAAMPLGLFTALLFTNEYGHWMAVIMLLPLLLARYAWKLYVESQQQYDRLVSAFVSSMEAKDTYTEGHSRRVNQYAMLITRSMKLKPAEAAVIRSAALLHDIGKIGIPDAILTKPGRLNDEEYAQIRRHPEIGVGIVERVGLPHDVVEIIRHHHEWYDGAGYPDGLSHDRLSQGAQILAVADAYDAMTSQRPYRDGMHRDVAFAELAKGKGSQFNPEIVDVMIAALTELGDGELPDGELS